MLKPINTQNKMKQMQMKQYAMKKVLRRDNTYKAQTFIQLYSFPTLEHHIILNMN